MSAPFVHLMEVIETSTKKWQCVPSEYENLKGYYARNHDGSLDGYDEWFNSHFHILTPEEIRIREENIESREKLLKRIGELSKDLSDAKKREKDIKATMTCLKKEADILLAKINGDDF